MRAAPSQCLEGDATLLIPISIHKQLDEFSDEMAMKLNILYYPDAQEASLELLGA
jgi:hypothetical protein